MTLAGLVNTATETALLEMHGPQTFGGPTTLHALTIKCFGVFEVRRSATGERIELCHNRNGQAILRYLIAQTRRRAGRDVLMEVFWPNDPPGVARHKLHVAVSSLRRSLAGADKGTGGYLIVDDADYAINPAADIRVDLDDFEEHRNLGQRSTGTVALEHFQAACNLYVGAFLRGTPYADWSQLKREQVTQSYLMMCGTLAAAALQDARYDDAARWAIAALGEDRCNEAAYRQLMRARAAAGRRGRVASVSALRAGAGRRARGAAVARDHGALSCIDPRRRACLRRASVEPAPQPA